MLGRVIDPAPRDVGDVQETVDATEIDEHAVVGDVLDDTPEDSTLLELGERLLLLLLVFLLEHGLARQHDVVAPSIEADDLELQLLPAQRVEMFDRLDVDQRPGQKGP